MIQSIDYGEEEDICGGIGDALIFEVLCLELFQGVVNVTVLEAILVQQDNPPAV